MDHDMLRQIQARRSFLGRSMTGMGSLALGMLLKGKLNAHPRPEFADDFFTGMPPKCKRVIHLCMAGGPSHLETLDYKAKLAELDGQPMPKSITEGQQIAQLQGQRNSLKILGPQHAFSKCGQSGQSISDILPHTQSIHALSLYGS